MNFRPRLSRVLVALALAGCARSGQPAGIAGAPAAGGPDAHVPDFARRPFEPFGRADAVAIALREWRAFGMNVNDGVALETLQGEARPDHREGLWQRVGEYWWLGQAAGTRQSGWTGRYDEFGVPFAGDPYAWSAAFVSYVMRTAGAGDRFPYSATHADYINAAARGNSPVLRAERPDAYAPRAGDLICMGRGGSAALRFDQLPTAQFPGHCDIVVAADPGQLTVVGGNVDASVTLKHVPLTAAGTLAGPDGTPADDRYPWFVVLRVLYDA